MNKIEINDVIHKELIDELAVKYFNDGEYIIYQYTSTYYIKCDNANDKCIFIIVVTNHGSVIGTLERICHLDQTSKTTVVENCYGSNKLANEVIMYIYELFELIKLSSYSMPTLNNAFDIPHHSQLITYIYYCIDCYKKKYDIQLLNKMYIVELNEELMQFKKL